MLRVVLVVALGAVVASGVSALTERPDAAVASVSDHDTLDRDDFDGGNGGDG